MSVRTRFAPSPTGALHIGSVRTALFSYLFARHHGGTFVLRIEDTDRERSSEESTRAILESLGWLGLTWDEGPYHQSERLDLYRARAQALLAAGAVYRCWCTPEELETRRQAALAAGRPPAYDRTCRERTASPAGRAAYALRFRTPLEGETVIDDHVKGRVVFRNADLDDFIIVRSDGMPVYNFCVVVDDHDMRITHVIRGDDLLASTPRQVLLYRAFGAAPPAFAHVPQILGLDKARLSKRHGATSVLAYREMGYLPDAVVNYLARLGWSHGDQELFRREELIAHFTLENVGKSAGIFNPEKLEWVNFQYMKATPAPALAELAEFCRFYLLDTITPDPKVAAKHLTPAIAPALADLYQRLATLPRWEAAAIEGAFQATLAAHGLKLGALAQPVRVAVTGGTVSPGIYEVLDVLGRERTIARLAAAVPRS